LTVDVFSICLYLLRLLILAQAGNTSAAIDLLSESLVMFPTGTSRYGCVQREEERRSAVPLQLFHSFWTSLPKRLLSSITVPRASSACLIVSL
jgi:hypothetical protein